MRVLVVDADVPFPPNSGKRLRSLNLVLPLARRHEITYVARAPDPDERALAADFLRDHGIAPILVDEPLPARSGPSFYGRLALSLASRLPYSVASHGTPRMRAAVAEAARRLRPHVTNVEYLGYLDGLDGGASPVVLQAHNVEALVWKRMAEQATDPLRRLFFAEQHRRYLAAEGQAFRRVAGVVACSATDAALARELYACANISVVDNGVDPAYFRDVRPEPGSQTVLFLGALDYRANIDAVEQLLDHVLPALRVRVPAARLAIVGRKPSATLRKRIAATDGATLHADVPDVRPYMAASAAMTVPLRIGGGSRLKILEALAAGLPVVTTTIGAEGLELDDGCHLAIADGIEAQVARLAAAIEAPGAAHAMAAHGRARVAERYAWGPLAARLEAIWSACAARHA